MEKPPLKFLLPNASKIQDIATPMPNYTIPPKGLTSTKMIDRRTIQDVSKEISIYPDPVYQTPS